MKEELRKLLDGIWNVPNVLTMLRLALVPLFAAVYGSGRPHLALLIFCLASLTDFFDGLIARRCHLITSFGKLMDPLADKFMVIGALTVLVYRFDSLRLFFVIALLIVTFRELAVTSLRLVASSSGVVVPANMLGKIKTVTQIVCICAAIIEPMLYQIPLWAKYMPTWLVQYPPLTLVAGVTMLVFTVLSGVNYFKVMWKYIDPEK